MPKQRRRRKSPPKELPLCEGPKLHLFPYHDSPIKWLERLGNDEDPTSKAYVFRAEINSRLYAVKVFKFYNPMEDEYYWGPLLGRDTPLDTAAYYNDPFYAECRAYGRINECLEMRKSPTLKDTAAACYGFFFLEEKDEEILSNRGVDLEYDMVDPKYQQKTPGGCRARAIVKDIAPSDPGVNEKSLSMVHRKIKALNRHGIYNRDIQLDNYGGGLLLDFGWSWTEPHRLLEALGHELGLEEKLIDKVDFSRMVRDEEIPNKEKVGVPHHMTLRKRDN